VSGGADIFAGQPSDADRLAELYDFEHDAITEDLGFYRELARRTRGSVLDLGCGSGRLFAPLLDGGARRIVGVDASAALLRRAAGRVAADPQLAQAAAAGRIELVECDVRAFVRPEHFSLIVVAGVLPHLDGPAGVLHLLRVARRRLTRGGRVVLDDIGPGLLPARDLPLSIDWRRRMHGQRLTRFSQLLRRKVGDGVEVAFSTLVEAVEADGTISRLPASYRLWYPSLRELERLVGAAGLSVELTCGSHDLDPLDRNSERRILVARRPGPRVEP